MKVRWADNGNIFISDYVKHIMTKYNFKHFYCIQLYDYCIKDKHLLSLIRSNDKY